MQLKDSLPNWVNVVIGLFTSWFNSKDPVEKAEAEVIESENLVKATEAKVEAKAVKLDAKQEKKVDKKIAKAKKAFKVERLKVGDPVYIKYPSVRRRKSHTFTGYDDKFVYTNDGKKFTYGQVYTKRGQPVLKPTIVTT